MNTEEQVIEIRIADVISVLAIIISIVAISLGQ